uniref:Large ribosomal subunit protein mL53 n=1 Tax=Paramormyrops kingsleyae TaxID=1676925 RepID=A0A3B3RYB1_9TELE
MATIRGKVLLKNIKSIVVQFCPFESNVRSTREFLAVVGSEKVRSTNMNCEVRTEVKHDGSDPFVNITFTDGERLLMKGKKLTSFEMLSALNSRCQAKDPHSKEAVN